MQTLYDDKDFYLNLSKNIIKTEKGYELQNAYIEVTGNDGNKTIKATNTSDFEHNCSICIYSEIVPHYATGCKLRKKLENLLPGQGFIPSSWVNRCEAYTSVTPLTIIKSEEEMIQFIENTEDLFGCPEEYESFYGFERKWDEDGTGEILETTREYYNRGGKFSEIPDRYPCVIYFAKADQDNYCHNMNKLHWIYIRDKECVNDKERT